MKILSEMTTEELNDFAFKPRGIRPRKEAAEVFPEKPEGYVRAFRNLTHYASNTWCARTAETEEIRIKYATIANRIYSELPKYAQLMAIPKGKSIWMKI